MSTERVGYGKELNYPGYLGQCMVGRVSYLGRVKQGNYHPNYTLPKPYPFIITYPVNHPTLDTQTGRVLPCASINTTIPWIPIYPYPDWESVTLCKYQHDPTLDTYLSLSFSVQNRIAAFQPFNTALFKTNFNFMFFLN